MTRPSSVPATRDRPSGVTSTLVSGTPGADRPENVRLSQQRDLQSAKRVWIRPQPLGLEGEEEGLGLIGLAQGAGLECHAGDRVVAGRFVREQRLRLRGVALVVGLVALRPRNATGDECHDERRGHDGDEAAQPAGTCALPSCEAASRAVTESATNRPRPSRVVRGSRAAQLSAVSSRPPRRRSLSSRAALVQASRCLGDAAHHHRDPRGLRRSIRRACGHASRSASCAISTVGSRVAGSRSNVRSRCWPKRSMTSSITAPPDRQRDELCTPSTPASVRLALAGRDETGEQLAGGRLFQRRRALS